MIIEENMTDSILHSGQRESHNPPLHERMLQALFLSLNAEKHLIPGESLVFVMEFHKLHDMNCTPPLKVYSDKTPGEF